MDTLAGVRPGFTANEVIAKLGPPGASSTPYRNRPLQRWIWQWTFFLPENNLSIELEAASEQGPFVVRAVIGHGLAIQTDRGVEVGCSADAVRRAYPDLVLEELVHPHEAVTVLRSGDLLFRFTGGHAGTIVLGTPSAPSDLAPATFPAPSRVLR